ncbi:MAG: phytanoyl-CoA dioxygenase family protein [Gammaproteobacteria bacterium]|nr:phytanoyl-CoA dioxygenase family protein [Gammaproteobacteria bacterium]
MGSVKNDFLLRSPSSQERLRSRIYYLPHFVRNLHAPSLSAGQSEIIEILRNDGCAVLDGYLAPEVTGRLRHEFEDCLHNLRFRTPALAQSRVDPVRHAQLLEEHLYASPRQLQRNGLAFTHDEAESYRQVLETFRPSTLTVDMLEYSAAYRQVWLDPYLLGIVAGYLGMVPRLDQAFVRRNFPAQYRSMNHFWHRDLNNDHHLLKIFFLLSDCDAQNGPHEYVRGSHENLTTLNGQRYYSDEQVDALYAESSRERFTGIGKSGMVIIEDTRGLHHARVPTQGYRDMGFAVFTPLRPFYRKRKYRIPKTAYDGLTPFQKAFIPKPSIA